VTSFTFWPHLLPGKETPIADITPESFQMWWWRGKVPTHPPLGYESR